jgi:error-prone DNA polymerase
MQGLGNKAKELLEKTWQKDGSFTSIEDLNKRSQLGSETIKELAKGGALESFIPERRKALWDVIALTKKYQKQKNGSSLPLQEKQLTLADLNIAPMTDLEKTIADYQTQHLSTYAHIMQFYRPWAMQKGLHACADLAYSEHGIHIAIAACIICRQQPATAKGFMFFTLEDETGLANIIIKPKILQANKKVLLHQNFVIISGQLQIDEGVINVIAEQAQPLPPIESIYKQQNLFNRAFHSNTLNDALPARNFQ